jgi:1-aminocyclopropane-1-carboxylate deaminase/D-cysteine desulfhydrase-like pyridoxal-dependent ACC family enzyme
MLLLFFLSFVFAFFSSQPFSIFLSSASVRQARLAADGAKPYAFPSGGSDAIGSWGYVEAIAEVRLCPVCASTRAAAE